MPKIIVCGEALIDFVPTKTAENELAFLPKPGGSPFNTAKAAARAGASAYFSGAFGPEFFSDQLKDDLAAAGVHDDLYEDTEGLTTLAFVDLSSGSPQYAFHNEGTANRIHQPKLNGVKLDKGSIICIGAVALIEPPASDNIVSFAEDHSAEALIAFDPNVRANLVADRAAWDKTLQRALNTTDILKLSDEDLEYIDANITIEDFAAKMLDSGIPLVIVTRGSEGAHAFNANGDILIKAPKIELVDAVGAGDTLMGSMLTWISENVDGTKAGLSALKVDQMADMLRFATTAAAINCTFAGCNPPSRKTIDASLANN